MSIGQPLEKLRKDFELLPNEVLIQYRSDPAKDAEGLPMSLLAGMELARRAAFQSQAAQQAAANTPPTVVDGATQALGLTPPPAPPAQPAAAPGQPPVAPGGIAGVPAQPTAAPQPMQQAPQPMQQAPQPMQQAPQEMQQAPAPGFSGGGAVAFSRGGMSPSTDVHIDQAILRELQMAESEAEAANDPGKVAEIRAKMSGLSSRLSTPAGAMQPATSPQVPKTPQDLYDMLREPGPATKAYAEALTAQQERLKGYKPALFDDATRAKMVADEFAKNQAVSKPFYDKQSQLLEEERKAAASGDSFNSSLMRLGLGMMLPNRGNLASTFGRSGIDAMNYYDQAEQAKAAALREARKGEMGLIRSRMADERGDRTSAQTYVSEAERRALTAQTGEDTRQAGLLGLSERNKTEEERRQQANAQRIETMRRNQEREEEMRLARLDRDEQAKERAQIARERIAEMAAGRGAGRGSGDSDIRAKAKFIEDTVNEVDKKIAKLKEKETDRTTLPPERARIKADIAVLEEERKKLRTTWGALVGVSMPTSPSSAAGWSGRKQDGGS